MTGTNIIKNIALITSSTRKRRLNPEITQYVKNVLEANASDNVKLQIVDIADYNLPLYDEPQIPSTLPKDDPTSHYTFEHTKKWSTEIRKYDGYVFVTPQYNWSIPAGLKNAIDYLFHEWNGKVGGIVSYGGHGGVRAADHLRTVMGGIKMTAVPTSVGLNIDRTTMQLCSIREEQLEVWKEANFENDINKMFNEMVDELNK